MKKFLLGILSAVAMTAPALAADLPVKAPPPPPMIPIFNWSGFYIGANGGWGQVDNCIGIVDPFFGPGVLADGCRNGSGGLFGGQVGYRWQTPGNHFVFGLEAQGDWANLRNNRASIVDPGLVFETKTDAIGLFTAQVGFGWDTWLLYFKGGAAVTSNNFTATDTLTGLGVTAATANGTNWGGTVGIGWEYAFSPNWSLGVEFDHLFMEPKDVVIPAGLFAGTLLHNSQEVNMFTVRFNYRFGGFGYGGPVVARY
jgi:outer membrane immunogenic protein